MTTNSNQVNDAEEVQTGHLVRQLAWELPAGMLSRILAAGITEILSAIDGRTVTVGIVTPAHIADECWDTTVQVLDEQSRPWVRAVISLKAARALAALLCLNEKDLEEAHGPIAVEARLSSNSQVEAAWDAYQLLQSSAGIR